MKLKNSLVAVLGCALCVSSVAAGPARAGADKRVDIDPEASLYDFQQANPQAKLHRTSDQITRIYGSAFGYGDSPEETAEQFRLDYAEMFGVKADDLDPRGPLADERHTQDVMYDRQTGRYKFTLVYYTQYESGLPVLGADLRLLVRNEPGYPLVLAASSLRDLGTFSVGRVEPIDLERAKQSAAQKVPGLINFGGPRRVIWAGVDTRPAPPTVAIELVADNGRRGAEDFARWLFVTDARSGEILYEEDLILNADVIGNGSGMATQGIGADLCEAEALDPMPYARVSVQGGNTAFADANGDFLIPNAGSDSVTVESPVRGRWFRVFNQGGPDTVLTTNVMPPGPADFIHNQANNNEFVRAEVNGYVEANVVRDFALASNPNYPVINGQTEFRVNVNINSSCNAFYDGSSINFYQAQGGCSNTANTTIVHHEYSHHLVATGGSGQGEYGEGMSDTVGVLITDQPLLAVGFFNDCNDWLRNADNNCQYQQPGCSSCGSSIHSCGQLLSGCIWSTRNELLVTEPVNYREILADLTINSILLHGGSGINPQITIDFLTLDDDDNDIGNGTPHYFEIDAGFGAHGMPAPPLDLCNDNGICEVDEDCNNCPNDCFSGSGASCGNGICEAGSGEDCLSCPDDCNGKQNGRPSGRFCCGDGDGQNPVGCGDSRCTSGDFDCTDVPGAASCCGDGVCEGSENGFNCEIDCGSPPPCGDGNCDSGEDCLNCPDDCPPEAEACNDGVDNDCDGDVDCDDADCVADPDCACLPVGEPCTDNGECCSNKCKGRQGRKTCK